MSIVVIRDRSHKMKHTVHVREHALPVDEPPANGGEDLGVTAHELYDSALGACKAMTVLWYAQRKQIPLDDIRVHVDARRHRRARRHLSSARRARTGRRADRRAARDAARVAEKCPVHKLMTQVTTGVRTELAPPGAPA